MVKSCCAIGCTERAKKGSGISFHSFPKDEIMKKRWIIATRREHFQPTASTRICSKHFVASDYIRHFGQLKLKEGVVPTVFNFPPHLIKPEPKKRSLRCSRTPSPLVSKKSKVAIPSTSSSSTHVDESENTAINLDSPINTTELSCSRENPRRNLQVPRFFGDLKYNELKSDEAKTVWRVAKRQICKKQKTIKSLRNRQQKLQKTVKRLKDVIVHLKESKKVSQDCYSILQESIPEAQKQLMLKQLRMDTKKKYSEELRTFALTLNFYSSSAYNYVRNQFSKCLPHPKTLLRWYEAVDGSPGYTKESLRAIELKAKDMEKEGKRLVCGLIMDEMSIRRHIQWNGKRQVGYVNYGFDIESDSLPEAKDAIVFLLVALNSRWKLPIGYFLINGLGAEEKANLVNGCLLMLHKVGVEIASLTFDGAAANLSMSNVLGANFSNVQKLKTYFPHPVTNSPVYIILDPCHMVKLIRNVLGDWGILQDKDGNIINWNFFKYLVALQDEHGLQAASKLRARHINYVKEKMRVKLAVQTLSDSVADALLYCCDDLQLPHFQNAQGTAHFCRVVNNLFDIMNTRNSLSRNHFKKPVSQFNKEFIHEYFEQARTYIYGLKTSAGEPILNSRRKTGFLGLLVNMCSIEGIVNDRIVAKHDLNYLLTYKLSQDHLEMFFSNIRSRGGFNNNPTAIQFESAYKKLLVHVELKSSEAANCLAQDETSILKVTSTRRSVATEVDWLCCDIESDNENEEALYNFDKFDDDVIEYIAGFVCKKLIKSFNCNICCASLTSASSLSLLLKRKNKGGLQRPSADVIKICKIAEGVFRTSSNLKAGNVINRLISVRQVNFNTLFQDLNEHLLDQDPLNNHLLQIIYNIFKVYFTVRLHHKNKSFNESKEHLRHMYTKLIHFKGQ